MKPTTRFLLLAPLLAATTGCATKRDLRDLRTTVIQSQARTDSALAALSRQNRMLLDSIARDLQRTNDAIVRMRGDLGNQLLGMEQQLIQLQELTGQSQRRLAELREQLNERAQQQAQPPAGPAVSGDTAGRPAAGGGDVAQLYQIGRENLDRGAAGTARRAFEEIVQSSPNDPLAPEAQLGIAETYVLERQFEQAFEAYDRVVSLFPSSAAAPRALYRAGMVALEAGNNPRAREYFTRVVRGYPNSDAAQAAADQLSRLR